MPYPIDQETLKGVAADYSAGLTYAQIHAKWHVSDGIVKQACKLFKVPMRGRGNHTPPANKKVKLPVAVVQKMQNALDLANKMAPAPINANADTPRSQPVRIAAEHLAAALRVYNDAYPLKVSIEFSPEGRLVLLEVQEAPKWKTVL